jgi:hypothetical protein
MNAFITLHDLHPVIDRIFPMGKFDEALRYLAAGHFVGNVVLQLDAAASAP